MNDKFDELAKGLAQSFTRRGALKKFGDGLAGIALASLGLASKAQADINVCWNDCIATNCSDLGGPASTRCKQDCHSYCKTLGH